VEWRSSFSRNYYWRMKDAPWDSPTAFAEIRKAAAGCRIDGNGDPLQVKVTLTHEEIAEIIGTTRGNREPPVLAVQKKQLVGN